MRLIEWGPDRLPDVARLWRLASPGEPLSLPELATVLLADEGTVLGTDDGLAVVAFVQGQDEARTRGNVRLLAVAPQGQRAGRGRALLAAAEARLAASGVRTVRLAGGVPRYLWPGIDVANRPARALAVSAGYQHAGTAVNMAIPTDFRAGPPEGVRVARAGADDAEPLAAMVRRHWPPWGTEADLARRQGTLFGAWAGDRPIGFAAHSTMRTGWIGPMGIDPDHRGRGTGAALLAAVCDDLEDRGHAVGMVAWVGPVDYFAARGARIARTFERFVKELR